LVSPATRFLGRPKPEIEMMKTSRTIRIQSIVNGEIQTVECDPSLRLLDFLRDRLHLTGTKEGCGKGECGACTVIMDGRTVDSCLVMAYQAQGSEIWTIEGLPRMWREQKGQHDHSTSDRGLELHPLQKAFIECGSSQCGICIPGMIMSGAHLLAKNPDPSADEIRYGLGGNLCRCTGYVKIFDAVKKAAAEMEGIPPLKTKARSGFSAHRSLGNHVVTTLKQALQILARHRGRHVAGGTDALVRAKDGVGSPAEMFDIFKIRELRGIRERKARRQFECGVKTAREIWIGAATTFTEVVESRLLKQYAPALVEASGVIGGPQIRNRGTLGGNFANASPAADSVTALMSMGAILELASLKKKREVAADKFFLGPGKTVLRRDELIVGIRIPKFKNVTGCYLRLGQRQAQAISKVDIAVTAVRGTPANADERGNNIEYLGIALGSVAPRVFRAVETETLLREQPISAKTLALAKEAVKREVRPIDDIRSTAEYRREMSAVLLERALRKAGVRYQVSGVRKNRC
jgi:carbon-monoxide dehydrogenase small subunit/xanthine dehydrogenase small subunit